MPKWIENGTEEQVVLDCDYSLDIDRERNLTIKWFFQSNSELIYEWIPRLDFRYVSGRLQGRFNWDYALNVSSEHDKNAIKWHRYRSLAIRRPTTELSGRYICQVITSKGDDAEEADMTIYGEFINSTVPQNY